MPLLSARSIAKRYSTASGGFYALRKTSLSFPSRGLIAIKGKSGSGKSTLLNILAGIENPSQGRVFLHGEDISRKGRPLLGHEAAMIFQHYNLIDGDTVFQNVSLPLSIKGEGPKKAKELLNQFGLWPLKDKDVRTLSGGEKQRVAICRALTGDPEILFADEPTGALDEQNSSLVMDALRVVSSSRLVLMVSHNEDLIARYADAVIEIVDGRIISSTLEKPPQEVSPKKKTHRRAGGRWVLRFLGKNIRQNLGKDAMCFLSGTLGFAALLLSFGFLVGNLPAMEAEQEKTLTYLSASISKRSVVEIPGSALSLVKQSRPSEEEAAASLAEIEDVGITTDYGYFFSSNLPFTCGDTTYEPVALSPLYDITLQEHGASLWQQGEMPKTNDFSSCVVNEEFIKHYGRALIGETVSFSSRSVVTYQGKQNEVFVDAHWRVAGVVREFAFLNVPRVYYSYQGLFDALMNIEVSGETGESTNLVAVAEEAAADSPYGNFSRLLFLHDVKDVHALHELIDRKALGEELEIQASSYSLRQSFLSLSSAFTSSLSLFVGIAMVGLALILGMASYSSLVAGRKQNAILSVLGAGGGSILSIYVFEAMVLCVGSSLTALLISPLLQEILNRLLYREFDIARLIAIPYQQYLGIPFLLVIGLVLAAALLGLLSSIVPLAIHHKMPIAEELRDE